MGVSEGALSGVGEECGTGVYPVRPGEFLSGQAGIGRNMRVDLPAGWEGKKSAKGVDMGALRARIDTELGTAGKAINRLD